jgi:hypothetical protein
MKRLFDHAAALFLAVFLAVPAALARAAEDGAALAPEPTVNVAWVAVFLVVFLGICAWFGIAIWRAERKNRVNAGNNAKA